MIAELIDPAILGFILVGVMLFAIFVGPFQTEDDIVNNMKLIQELSESNKGEISRWKL